MKQEPWNGTKTELISKIQILLAGKATEELIFNHQSTGAKDDLQKVTDIATNMVCDYGMSKLGLITIDKNTKNFLSEPIQKEINNIVNTCYENTLKILRENINDLHIVSKFLFENETMTCDQLEDLIRKEAAN